MELHALPKERKKGSGSKEKLRAEVSGLEKRLQTVVENSNKALPDDPVTSNGNLFTSDMFKPLISKGPKALRKHYLETRARRIRLENLVLARKSE